MENLETIPERLEDGDQPPVDQQAGDLAGDTVATRRVGVLVMGMHRSGSSAITRMLGLLGCTLPQTPMPAAFDNPRGHWESQRVADFNDEILGLAGTRWNDWLPVNPRLSETLVWPQLVARGRDVLREEFGDAPLFVLKDPRICKLGGFWAEVLAAEGIDTAFVLPLRNPLEVAQSLSARDGIEEHHGLLIWLCHVLAAEAASRGRPRVFTDYAGLLDHWEEVSVSLSTGLGLVWPRVSALSGSEIAQFLTPDLRHHVSRTAELKKNPAVSPWITKAYEVLLDWARHGEKPADHAVLDQIWREYEDAGIAFARPMLNSELALQRVSQADAERIALTEARDAIALHLGAVEAELAQAIVEQDGRTAERDGLAVQRAALAEERDAISWRLDVVEAELAQVREERDVRAAERDKFAAECAVVANGRDVVAWRLGEVEAELAQAKEDRNTWMAGHNELARTHAELVDERNKVAWRLGEVVAEFTQACDQRAMLVEERNTIAWRIGEVEAERSDARMQNDNLSARVLELEGDRASADGKIDALEHRLAVTESTLRQRDEEIAQLGTELDAARLALVGDIGAIDAVHYDAHTGSPESPSAENSITTSNEVGVAQLDQMQRELAEARKAWWMAEDRARVAESQADARNLQLADRFAELAQLAKLLQQSEREIEASQAELGKAQAGLANRAGEIATVTQLYWEQERQADVQGAQVDWLRQVHAMISKTPYWWAFVPSKWRRSQQLHRLRIKGLFDDNDYLARYPDVAASGMDPLRHYIFNGMIEGRSI